MRDGRIVEAHDRTTRRSATSGDPGLRPGRPAWTAESRAIATPVRRARVRRAVRLVADAAGAARRRRRRRGGGGRGRLRRARTPGRCPAVVVAVGFGLALIVAVVAARSAPRAAGADAAVAGGVRLAGRRGRARSRRAALDGSAGAARAGGGPRRRRRSIATVAALLVIVASSFHLILLALPDGHLGGPARRRRRGRRGLRGRAPARGWAWPSRQALPHRRRWCWPGPGRRGLSRCPPSGCATPRAVGQDRERTAVDRRRARCSRPTIALVAAVLHVLVAWPGPARRRWPRAHGVRAARHCIAGESRRLLAPSAGGCSSTCSSPSSGFIAVVVGASTWWSSWASVTAPDDSADRDVLGLSMLAAAIAAVGYVPARDRFAGVGHPLRLRGPAGPGRGPADVRQPADPGHADGRAAAPAGRVAAQDDGR